MTRGQTMGTTYEVKFFSGSNVSAEEVASLFSQIAKELEQVNKQMSTYDPDSELSQFNAHDSDDWFPVSTDLVSVTEHALSIGEVTGGAFDVTVGPLVDLWGFGPAGRPEKVPADEVVAETLLRIGWKKLETQASPPALKKSQSALRVDLSAIAKGHAVDRVAELLESEGIDSYFVEIGGEVRVGKQKPDGVSWRVGVESPIIQKREIFYVAELSETAMATSGNYRNFYVKDGEFYSHTIDPRTGYPVKDKIVSATVVAPSCGQADAIATGMMALGFEEGLALAESQGWAVLLIGLGKEAQPELSASKDFLDAFPDIRSVIESAQAEASSKDDAESSVPVQEDSNATH